MWIGIPFHCRSIVGTVRTELLSWDRTPNLRRMEAGIFKPDGSNMTLRRIFMDWSEPALPQAVDHFARHHLDHDKKRLDMDDVLVVVPGSRVGRRLSQLLASKAKELGVVLFPPAIQTAGHLPEKLYEPKKPFADEVTQNLAWIKAIQNAGRKANRHLPNLPDKSQTVDWLDLASMLASVHRELAADGLDFSDVVEQGKKIQGFAEAGRWRFLASVQDRYLEILDELGLWDLQTARLFAIKHEECHTDATIYLLGTVDLNRATRKMLKQVAQQVTALIHAPESHALGFDEFGCLEPSAWIDRRIPLRDDQILVADQPEDQASAVCYLLGEMDNVDPSRLVIGTPTSELASYVERKLDSYGISTHRAVGRRLSESTPGRLLQAIGSFLELNRFPEFAAIVRHTDIEAWLAAVFSNTPERSVETIISECDAYYARHLPPDVDSWLESGNRFQNLKTSIDLIQDLIKPLKAKPAALTNWTAPILELLADVYSNVELDSENRQDAMTIRALSEIRNTLESFAAIPRDLDLITTASEVIRLLNQQLSRATGVDRPRPHSVDLLGWLELPLDTANQVILTGFNEGIIPESRNSDMFLPDGMRKVLGLTDNRRRYARDAHAIESMIHSRKYLRVIVGRRDLAGDPVNASRIFFATDRESIARRVRMYAEPATFIESTRDDSVPDVSAFVVPRPDNTKLKIESISVTSFRTYLACPYRFYLNHVLRLSGVNDEGRELDALSFGNLLHEIFRSFGESRLRYSSDHDEIKAFLDAELDTRASRTYGSHRLPAVEIQLQQARRRLAGFAKWQAERTRAGWEIKFVEKKPNGNQGIDFEFEPGRTVRLKGTIDRIDYHEQQDRWQILDYKTGDSGKKPAADHQDQGKWINLQLPLYRFIARSFEVDGRVDLGYILVPKSVENVGEAIADWSNAEIEQAIDLARTCSRDIVDGKFWEPTYPAPTVGSEFAVICQDNVFEPRLATAEPAEMQPGGSQTGSGGNR